MGVPVCFNLHLKFRPMSAHSCVWHWMSFNDHNEKTDFAAGSVHTSVSKVSWEKIEIEK